MTGISAGVAAEWCCAIEGAVIREIMQILNRLDELNGYSSPLSGLHVQGGEHTPTAERRAELLERLGHFPPVLLGVAKAFRVVSHEKAGYTLGILDGLHGEPLRKRARLSLKKHRECRLWLLRVMEPLMKGRSPSK